MNPRDYTTWTSFADHPIFADKERSPTEWSSDPATYDDFRCDEFLPEWYIHVNPKPSTAVQAAIAERDIKNFAAACHEIHQAFGSIDHELFILDDLTVLVSLRSEAFHIDFYGHDYGDNDQIMSIYLLEPRECDFMIDSVSEFVPRLRLLLSNT
jgi:hypothetical protein